MDQLVPNVIASLIAATTLTLAGLLMKGPVIRKVRMIREYPSCRCAPRR